MSSITKIFVGLCLVAFAAACAPQQEEEVVFVEPEPVEMDEPRGETGY